MQFYATKNFFEKKTQINHIYFPPIYTHNLENKNNKKTVPNFIFFMSIAI